tara:strand:- start:22398 stop:22955 length:558 start_codon:yes stop_codon:yes gene_type:complete
MPEGWPGAWFLTDPQRVPDPVAVIPALPPGTGVIYRHFGADDRHQTARALRQACYQSGRVLLIANDPELAVEVRADGLHWPEARAHQARNWQGAFLAQTQSAHSPRALREAVCEAVLFSTVFPSNSPSAGKAIGATRFRTLCRRASKIIYALGGVNGGTAGAVTPHSGLAGIEGFAEPAANLDRE